MTPSLPQGISDWEWDWIDDLGKEPRGHLRVSEDALKRFCAKRLSKAGLIKHIDGEYYWTTTTIEICHEFWCQHVATILKRSGQR